MYALFHANHIILGFQEKLLKTFCVLKRFPRNIPISPFCKVVDMAFIVYLHTFRKHIAQQTRNCTTVLRR